jgi:hypothetical protein
VDGYQYKYTFLEDVSLSVGCSSFFKKNLKKCNERKQFKELLILNKLPQIGYPTSTWVWYTTVDTFSSELSCKLQELKGLKNFEEFDFYDDSKRQQITFLL